MSHAIRLTAALAALTVLLIAPPLAGAASNRPSQVPRLSADPSAVAKAKARGAKPAPGTTPLGGNTDVLVAGSGLNQPGLTDANWTPSDAVGAIGTSHDVEIVEERVATYDRKLNLVSSLPLNQFFGAPEGIGCEPQVLWDAGTKRFYYAGIDCDGVGSYHLYYGWSKGPDPTDLANGWCRYEIDTGSANEDSPRLGDDNTHIIIGTNVYDPSPSFAGVHVWALDKPGSGACPAPPASPAPLAGVGTANPMGDSYGPVPANITDSSTKGYVTAGSFAGSGAADRLHAFRVGASGPDATFSTIGDISVGLYLIPNDAPQPGGGPDLLDTGDGRLTQAVAHRDPGANNAEAVWTQHTVCTGTTSTACSNAGGRSVVRWYELIPETLTRRQLGDVAFQGGFAFNGAVSPAQDGTTAAIQYNTASGAELVKLVARSRDAAAPLGAMGPGLNLATSVAQLHDGSCPSFTAGFTPCRWGNYVALTPDPTTTGTVWGVNQVTGPDAGGQGQWQTRVFALADSPVATLVGGATSVSDGNDNIIRPGESFSLDEQLRNIGGAGASGIAATLTPKTNEVTIGQGSSAYPDAAPGANVTNTTPFQATMAPTAKCGRTLAMNLHAATGQGQFDIPVSVSSGASGPLATIDATSPQVPAAIPEQGTVTSTITVNQGGILKQAAVAIPDLQHTFISDLDVVLRAPDGTTVPLIMRRGAGGDNLTNTLFTDSASTPIANGTAPFTGSFKPDSPLAALQGHAMRGTWTLTIHDMFAPDGGTLNAWGLRLTPASC